MKYNILVHNVQADMSNTQYHVQFGKCLECLCHALVVAHPLTQHGIQFQSLHSALECNYAIHIRLEGLYSASV